MKVKDAIALLKELNGESELYASKIQYATDCGYVTDEIKFTEFNIDEEDNTVEIVFE